MNIVSKMSHGALSLLLLVVSWHSLAAAEPPPIKPALWQVNYQGNTAYLLGSIHIGSQSWYPLPDYVLAAYRSADTLVVELDAVTRGPELQRAMMLPAGATLSQHLSKTTYKKLSEFMQSFGVPMAVVSGFKPWAAASVAAILPYMKQGLSPQYGVDAHLLALAAKDGKALVELETPQFQLDLLEQMLGNDKAILELLELPQEEVVSIVSYWKVGNMDKLAKLMQTQMNGQQFEQMLTKRNQDWVGKIKKLMGDKQHLFVVVGAAHLAGQSGVPALLAQQGISVKRID